MNDMGAEYSGSKPLRDTRYAVIEFEDMVRKAKADGVITQDEAIGLTTKHWKLQENSRRALEDLLQSYGYKQVEIGTKPRKITLPATPDVDYHRKGIHLIRIPKRKTQQRVVWLSIVGLAVLASLLGVLGVI